MMIFFDGKCDDKYGNYFFISNKNLVICSKLNSGIITTDLKQIIATVYKQEMNE